MSAVLVVACLIVVVVAFLTFWRVDAVSDERHRWIAVVFDQPDWFAKDRVFDDVGFDRMVLTFWRSPRSFAPDWLRELL